MKRAVLQAPTPQRLAQLDAAVRRYLPDLGAALVGFSDAEEASQWILMHEPALLLLERDGSGFDPAQLQQLREQWPLMHQLYLPEQIFIKHPANDIFARQVEAILATARNSFVGTTAIASLVQLIQFIEYAQLNGTLCVQLEGSRVSTVGFVQGQIVSARSESEVGVDALVQMLTLTRGVFRWMTEAVVQRNVEAHAGARLLLEVVRQRDEQRWRTTGTLEEDSSIMLAAPAPEEEPLLRVKLPGGQSVRSGTPALNSARQRVPERGFVGGFSLAQLVDVIQLHSIACSTGILYIYYGLREAQIHYNRGEIVHAICGRVEGESAFIMVMELRQGSFMFSPQPVTEHTIRTNLMKLLLGMDEEEQEEEVTWAGEGAANPFSRPPKTAPIKGLDERPRSGLLQRPVEVDAEVPDEDHPLKDNDEAIEALAGLARLDGFLWTALVSARHGVLHLAQAPGGQLTAEAIAGASLRLPALLGETLAPEDMLEDTMLITAESYLLFRPLSEGCTTFLMLALGRKQTHLGLARLKFGAVEESLRAMMLREKEV